MTDNIIQYEDDSTIQTLLEEYNKLESTDKVYLPNCLYSFHEVVRESIRREYLKVERSQNEK